MYTKGNPRLCSYSNTLITIDSTNLKSHLISDKFILKIIPTHKYISSTQCRIKVAKVCLSAVVPITLDETTLTKAGIEKTLKRKLSHSLKLNLT